MKKKLSLFLCALVLALGVTACGEVSDDDVIADRTVKEYRDEITEYMEAYGSVLSGDDSQIREDLSQQLAMYYNGATLEDLAEAQGVTVDEVVDLYKESYLDSVGQIAFPEDSTLVADLREEFQECIDEAGDYKGVKEFTVEKSGKTVTSTIVGDFSKRDLKMTFVYSTLDTTVPTAMNVEPVYTLGETMQKAALNTVMGILIVFFMLIIMSGVIKCFEIIPKLQNKAKEKAENVAATPAVAPVQSAVKNETDDLQLVAVIAAAIAASTGASTDSFVVRSIKKRR